MPGQDIKNENIYVDKSKRKESLTENKRYDAKYDEAVAKNVNWDDKGINATKESEPEEHVNVNAEDKSRNKNAEENRGKDTDKKTTTKKYTSKNPGEGMYKNTKKNLDTTTNTNISKTEEKTGKSKDVEESKRSPNDRGNRNTMQVPENLNVNLDENVKMVHGVMQHNIESKMVAQVHRLDDTRQDEERGIRDKNTKENVSNVIGDSLLQKIANDIPGARIGIANYMQPMHGVNVSHNSPSDMIKPTGSIAMDGHSELMLVTDNTNSNNITTFKTSDGETKSESIIPRVSPNIAIVISNTTWLDEDDDDRKSIVHDVDRSRSIEWTTERSSSTSNSQTKHALEANQLAVIIDRDVNIAESNHGPTSHSTKIVKDDAEKRRPAQPIAQHSGDSNLAAILLSAFRKANDSKGVTRPDGNSLTAFEEQSIHDVVHHDTGQNNPQKNQQHNSQEKQRATLIETVLEISDVRSSSTISPTTVVSFLINTTNTPLEVASAVTIIGGPPVGPGGAPIDVAVSVNAEDRSDADNIWKLSANVNYATEMVDSVKDTSKPDDVIKGDDSAAVGHAVPVSVMSGADGPGYDSATPSSDNEVGSGSSSLQATVGASRDISGSPVVRLRAEEDESGRPITESSPDERSATNFNSLSRDEAGTGSNVEENSITKDSADDKANAIISGKCMLLTKMCDIF